MATTDPPVTDVLGLTPFASLRPFGNLLAVLPAAQPALPVAAVSGSPGLFSPAELVDFQRRTAVAGDAAVRAALLRSMIDAAASLPTITLAHPSLAPVNGRVVLTEMSGALLHALAGDHPGILDLDADMDAGMATEATTVSAATTPQASRASGGRKRKSPSATPTSSTLSGGRRAAAGVKLATPTTPAAAAGPAPELATTSMAPAADGDAAAKPSPVRRRTDEAVPRARRPSARSSGSGAVHVTSQHSERLTEADLRQQLASVAVTMRSAQDGALAPETVNALVGLLPALCEAGPTVRWPAEDLQALRERVFSALEDFVEGELDLREGGDTAWEEFSKGNADNDDALLPLQRQGGALRTTYVALQLGCLLTAADGNASGEMPEESLHAAITLLRNVADRVALPYAERKASDEGIRNLAKPAVAALDDVLYRLGDCVRALTDLLVHVRLADSLVTTVAVLAQHAFLGDATTPLGAAGAKLLSTLFSHYTSYRDFILDDLLTSVKRGTAARAAPSSRAARHSIASGDTGRPLQPLTQLLLELTQASSASLTAFQILLPLGSNAAAKTQHAEQLMINAHGAWKAAMATATHCVHYLVTRATTTKVAQAENEARAVLESVLTDLLTVLGSPEWPAAELFLTLFAVKFVTTLEENPVAATAQADEKRASSAARAQCLDYLGQIICRLRAPPQAPPTAAGEAAPFAVRPDTPLEDLSALLDAADCIASYLLRTRGGGARELDAHRFHLMVLAQEVAASHKPEQSTTLVAGQMELIERRFRWTSATVPAVAGDEGVSTATARARPAYAAWLLSTRRMLHRKLPSFLTTVVQALKDPQPTLRTRALKVLCHVVECRPTPQDLAQMVPGLTGLEDESPQVREAATDFLGRLFTLDKTLSKQYFSKLIPARAIDASVAVRKRAIGVIQEALERGLDVNEQLDAFFILLQRTGDSEASVQTEASRVLQALLFEALPGIAPWSAADAPPAQRTAHADLPAESRAKLTKRLDWIEAMARDDECTTHLLRWVLRVIHMPDGRADALAHCKAAMPTLYAIADAAAERATTLETAAATNPEARAKLAWTAGALALIVRAVPAAVAPHTTALASLLALGVQQQSPSQPIDEAIVRTVMHTCTVVAGVAPVLAAQPPVRSICTEIERALHELTRRMSAAVVKQSVPAFCAVAQHLTRDPRPLVAVLAHYFGFLHERRKATALPNNDAGHARRALLVLGLMALHYDFDPVRHTFAPDSVVQRVCSRHKTAFVREGVYELALDYARLTAMPALQPAAIQTLALLAEADVRYAVREPVRMLLTSLMDGDHVPPAGATATVRLIMDVLEAEEREMEARQAARRALRSEDGIGTDELRATSAHNADLGVGMQLAQWYHKPVLNLLLHVDTSVRKTALDVMANMLRRGIVMPMVVVPYLAALAGVDSKEVAPRAVQALEGIAKRHPEFLQSRTADSIPLTFRLQRTLYVANAQHEPHNTGAPLDPIYALLKKGSVPRFQFLGRLVAPFGELAAQALRRVPRTERAKEELLPEYLAFLADNLFTLNYGAHDEPRHVAQEITRFVQLYGEELQSKMTEVPSDDPTVAGPTMTNDPMVITATGAALMLVYVNRAICAIFNIRPDTLFLPPPENAGSRAAVRQGDIKREFLQLPQLVESIERAAAGDMKVLRKLGQVLKDTITEEFEADPGDVDAEVVPISHTRARGGRRAARAAVADGTPTPTARRRSSAPPGARRPAPRRAPARRQRRPRNEEEEEEEEEDFEGEDDDEDDAMAENDDDNAMEEDE